MSLFLGIYYFSFSIPVQFLPLFSHSVVLLLTISVLTITFLNFPLPIVLMHLLVFCFRFPLFFLQLLWISLLKIFLFQVLPPPTKMDGDCFHHCLSVCLSVCEQDLKKLWTDSDEICWTCWVCDKADIIRF